jgi:predicted dehydrogenase
VVVNIGIIGTGFIAETRARCYASVSGLQPRLVAAANRTLSRGQAYAQRWGIPNVYDDYRRVLDRPDVDVVDLCVPNFLHRPITEAAAQAGKHVICSKPLTAFDGPGSVPRAEMLSTALANARAMVSATDRAGVQLMYGENWVYAPSVVKAARLAEVAGGAILEMRGGECHSGSHSPYSKEWQYTGGGALLRLGVHALGAMLHLKRQEGLRRTGTPIRPRALIADVGDLTRTSGFDAQQSFVGTGWVDVENWGTLILTFDDGTRATVFASDAVLGGMDSTLEVFLSNAHLRCNLAHNRLLDAYAPDASIFRSEYLMEKLETSAGWSQPAPDEDWAQGHKHMVQDFVSAVAESRPALADGALGLDVIHVVYAAYLAAEQGRRVELSPESS